MKPHPLCPCNCAALASALARVEAAEDVRSAAMEAIKGSHVDVLYQGIGLLAMQNQRDAALAKLAAAEEKIRAWEIWYGEEEGEDPIAQRDAALARVRVLEDALDERTKEWQQLGQYQIENENHGAHVARLREALEPMLAVLDGWVGDRTLFDSTPLHNIRAAARAVLEETK